MILTIIVIHADLVVSSETNAKACTITNYNTDAFIDFVIEDIRNNKGVNIQYDPYESNQEECFVDDTDPKTPVFIVKDLNSIRAIGEATNTPYIKTVMEMYDRYGNAISIAEMCRSYFASPDYKSKDMATFVLCNWMVYNTTISKIQQTYAYNSTLIHSNTTRTRAPNNMMDNEGGAGRQLTGASADSSAIGNKVAPRTLRVSQEEIAKMVIARRSRMDKHLRHINEPPQQQQQQETRAHAHEFVVGSDGKWGSVIDRAIHHNTFLADKPTPRKVLSNVVHFLIDDDDHYASKRVMAWENIETAYDYASRGAKAVAHVYGAASRAVDEEFSRSNHLSAQYAVDVVGRAVKDGLKCMTLGDNIGVWSHKEHMVYDDDVLTNRKKHAEGSHLYCVPSRKGPVVVEYLSNPFDSAGFSGFSQNDNNNFNLLSPSDWSVLLKLMLYWLFHINVDEARCMMGIPMIPDEENMCKYPIITPIPHITYPYGFNPSNPGCESLNTPWNTAFSLWYIVTNDYIYSIHSDNPRYGIVTGLLLYNSSTGALPPNLIVCVVINMFTFFTFILTFTVGVILIISCMSAYRRLTMSSRFERLEYARKIDKQFSVEGNNRLLFLEASTTRSLSEIEKRLDEHGRYIENIAQGLADQQD
jgi:hypothetical protein